jgi:hypothetical protein
LKDREICWFGLPISLPSEVNFQTLTSFLTAEPAQKWMINWPCLDDFKNFIKDKPKKK